MSDVMGTEVVTHARVRTFDLPHGAGRMALITLDNDKDHTRPSTFGPQGMIELATALDEVRAMPGLAAVAITGKPFIFAVGADLSGIGAVTQRDQILQFAQLGHATFTRLHDLGVPTFAFINGAAMGGGTELALHCDYRTLSSASAALSLPEVFLGLVPGWGGAWLLPNLVGPAAALEVIIGNSMAQNKQLRPKDAVRLGVVDVVLDAAGCLERSIDWAARVLTGAIEVPRPEPDRASWDAVVAAVRAQVDERIHGATPAPYRALDLVEAAKTASRAEGFAAEDEALADLVMGDDTRASMYAFDLVQRRAKKPAGAPDRDLARPVRKVGIVGAGLMASQLALLFARKLQVPVVMSDLDQARVDKGLAYVRQEVESLRDKRKLTPDRAARDGRGRRHGGRDRGHEQSAMASGLAHPERVVGFHFFNPVAVMPLLEIARAEHTDDATLATAFAVGKGLGKSCVLVKDSPGFVVNRLLTRFMGEITDAMDEGTDPAVADSAMASLGLPMTPFMLLQLVGPAVALHVSETMNGAFPDWWPLASEGCGPGTPTASRPSTPRWRLCSPSAPRPAPASRCATAPLMPSPTRCDACSMRVSWQIRPISTCA